MSFKDIVKSDAISVFLNSNEFAEEIEYTPKDDIAKKIKAIVTRESIEPADEAHGHILQNQAQIEIANDSTYGVTEVTENHDTASLPERAGGTAIDWRVVKIRSKAGGMWTLLLQK